MIDPMETLELDVLMIRVNMHLANGRYVEARRVLEDVLADDPGHGIAHGLMGWLCWILLDDADRASVHYRAAIRFAPDHAPHYERFAETLAASGRVDELRRLVDEATAVAGADKAALHGQLARALERAGRAEEALAAYRAAVSAATDLTTERNYTAQAARVRRKLGPTGRWFAW